MNKTQAILTSQHSKLYQKSLNKIEASAKEKKIIYINISEKEKQINVLLYLKRKNRIIYHI